MGTAGKRQAQAAGRLCMAIELNPTPGVGRNGTDKLQWRVPVVPSERMKVFMRIFFPNGYDFSGELNTGGKLGIGLFFGEGVSSGGELKSNGGSSRVTMTGNPRYDADDAFWEMYNYHQQQARRYGDGHRLMPPAARRADTGVKIVRGRWLDVTIEGVAQSLSSIADGSSGIVVRDTDTQDILARYRASNMRWVTAGDTRLRQVIVSFFHGGTNRSSEGHWVPAGKQTLYVEKMYYTTSPA
jgi:hypothetical protein